MRQPESINEFLAVNVYKQYLLGEPKYTRKPRDQNMYVGPIRGCLEPQGWLHGAFPSNVPKAPYSRFQSYSNFLASTVKEA